MKVRVIKPHFTSNGLVFEGQIIEAEKVREGYTEEIQEESPEEAPEEKPKRRTTRKKN